MVNTALNRTLHAAKATKQDEYYTQLSDIEKELRHYTKHFKNKTVLCNCDDPKVSNFFHYFSHNFEKLELKKLITTCYKNCDADLFSQRTDERGIYLEYNGDRNDNRVPDPDEIGIHKLKGDGDFRSEECVKLLEQADIVVTNPPFSLFREYVAQLMKYKKKFVILGNQNAITYTDIFTLIRENKVWLGVNNGGTKWFEVNADYDIKTKSRKKVENGRKFFSMGSVNWYTNLDIAKRHEELITFEKYDPRKYPRYDNYDAIEVATYKAIPIDYDGAMGVPITFLDKYNPQQFEILGWTRGVDEFDAHPTKRYVNAKQVKPDGTKSNGGKVNTGPTLLLKKKPSSTHYIAENADGYLEQLYMRIVIKRKN
jgi:adenine-specific methyltransferase EcoRI-like protein